MSRVKQVGKELLEVEWRDHSSSSGWQRVNLASKNQVVTCRTVGWLLNEDHLALRLFSARCDDFEDVGDVHLILKNCIVKRRKLR